MRDTNRGVTLIELMIVVAIIGIIGMVAYPWYASQMLHGKRSDGREFSYDLVALQERFYAQNTTYALNWAALNIGPTVESDNGHYSFALATAADGQSYVITATPANGFVDGACPALTIDQNLQKLPATCW